MTDQRPEVIRSADPFTPAEMALLVENVGIRKATLATDKTLVLGVLAGAFIAFGAMLFTVTVSGTGFGYGPTRLLGGIAFSLGLILVIVGGAELFTGNNLIVMAWASRKVTTRQLLRNWVLVYLGNLVGALATAMFMAMSGALNLADGAPLATAAAIAKSKIALPFIEALVRGILCNVLVCLAVWLTFAARDVSGKILAIVFPITAFVALGFEHSVANMYFIPVAIFSGAEGVGWSGLAANLVPVTIGNIIGGGVLVALVYWLVYLRDGRR